MLTTVTMQENVASIESKAFSQCNSLRNVVVYAKDALTSISEDAAFPQNEGMGFYGWANSILESWATEHGFAFRKLDDLKDADGSINWNKMEKTVWLELACVMEAGDERKLDWSVFPQTEGLSLQWSSSAPEIVRVDENGVVTALKNGTATVSLTVAGKTVTCEVFVGEYLDGGMCGNDVIWKLTQDGALTISGTGPMYDFEYYGSNFWSVESDRIAITSVQIEDGVTRIGNNAFGTCVNMETVDIPDSVTSIGDDSFSGCESLKTINIPNGVTRIGERAFCFCTGLTAINLPDSVTRIEYLAFDNCTSLKTINIPDGVTSIEHGLFSECESLTTIHLPNSVTSIDQEAFFGCKSLTTINIPNGVTSIGGSAFWNCTSLTTISIPNGVTSIGNGAFWNCTSLTTIGIPDSVTSIQSGAFYNCENLTVTLPNNVQTIGAEAFASVKRVKAVPNTVTARVLTENNIPYWDSQLVYEGTTVVDCADDAVEAIVPDGITSIGEWAFSWNPNLKSVTLPDSVTSIGDRAFLQCTGLETVDIPANVTEIGAYAFTYCKKLTAIDLPDGVTSIKEYTFYCCVSLAEIGLPKNLTSIGDSAFAGCKSLTTFPLPDSVTSIGDSAFSSCTALTTIRIPDGVTSIGPQTFYICDALMVELPNNIQTIGAEALSHVQRIEASFNTATARALAGAKLRYWDGSLQYDGTKVFDCAEDAAEVVIPDGVTSIGDSAFRDCKKLTSIKISNDVMSIGDSAFYECESLTSIDIPDGVTSIGAWTFIRCKNLVTVVMPDGVTSIGDSAFSGCEGLTTISIPNGVTSIGDSAFSSCKSLTAISIPNGVTSIDYRAFCNCPNLKWITIPESVTSIGSSAFEGCTQLRQVVFLTKDSLTNIGDAGIPSGATIYCWEYYYAETWARERGYTVRLLDDLLDENGNIDWSRAEKSVSLQSDCTLEPGEQRALSYGYFPTERTFAGVWSSSNPAVATVDENGVVTALQNGETVITLTEEGASATCNVRVRTTLKSFELSRSELYLPAKGTGKLSIVAMDPADSDDTFSWSISDATYATIDQEGNITAKTIGNATITVTSSSGITRTCALHITYPVTKVAFAEASAALHPGMTRTLTANVTMRTMKCVNQMVDFSSSNESVATVDEYGTVTAVGAGSATITATAQGNDTIHATCEITVTGDHEIAVDAAVPATRTREGLTEGSHCAICGEVLVAQETVPARTDLSVLSLPAATKEIEAEAFAGSAVECAAIPDGCERIGNKAFAQCAALELAEIPASITSIADDAFAGSERLVIVTAEGSYAQTYATNHGIPCVAE